MLLNNLINQQQDRYNQFQAQIELLQEEQRKIQAYLQNLGSIESKMESAAALVAEAIAEINNHCPEELEAYKKSILGLFDEILTLPSHVEEPQSAVDDKNDIINVDVNEDSLNRITDISDDDENEVTIDVEATEDSLNKVTDTNDDTKKDPANIEIFPGINESALNKKSFSEIKLLAKSLGVKITSKQATIKAIIQKVEQ